MVFIWCFTPLPAFFHKGRAVWSWSSTIVALNTLFYISIIEMVFIWCFMTLSTIYQTCMSYFLFFFFVSGGGQYSLLRIEGEVFCFDTTPRLRWNYIPRVWHYTNWATILPIIDISSLFKHFLDLFCFRWIKNCVYVGCACSDSIPFFIYRPFSLISYAFLLHQQFLLRVSWVKSRIIFTRVVFSVVTL